MSSLGGVETLRCPSSSAGSTRGPIEPFHSSDYDDNNDAETNAVDADEQLLPAPLSWFEEKDEEETRTIPESDEINDDEEEEEEVQRSKLERKDSIEQQQQQEDEDEEKNEKQQQQDQRGAGIRAYNHHHNHHQHKQRNHHLVGSPLPSPSWKEISSQVLPNAARELLSSSLQRICYTARLSYAQSRWHRTYSELGSNTGGYYSNTSGNGTTTSSIGSGVSSELPAHLPQLPPFSSLSWVERQLVQEWRTYRPNEIIQENATSTRSSASSSSNEEEEEEEDFDRARTLVPVPVARPIWQKAEVCFACHKTFGPTRLRHHCRLCGRSFCQPHSAMLHKLPHLGYHPDVPERVCDACKHVLLERNLAERVAWRLARCRDYNSQGKVVMPYFETGVDTVEDAAMRVTQAALAMARSVPLGAQATVAVETVDVLRKHGLNGIYTIMLRQEFLAAADMLRKALGINRSAWPLSVHELSAAIFYALAQHRAMRGMHPEREHLIHSFRVATTESLQSRTAAAAAATLATIPVVVDSEERAADDAAIYKTETANISDLVSSNTSCSTSAQQEEISDAKGDDADPTTPPSVSLPFQPVCDPVPASTLASLIFYAPMALNFIYAEKEVDLQLLAAQQGWRLLYAYLEQETGQKAKDRPASAFFIHEEQKIACIAVRGTSTIHDVVTDIRQQPVPFPDTDVVDQGNGGGGGGEEEWTTVFRGNGLAVCGMAGAAVNLYREHIDSILVFAKQGYRIRLAGHSLGGGVATLLGALVLRDMERLAAGESSSFGEKCGERDAPLRVYAYGTPSCVDARLADDVASFVTTVVLHDDVVPRLTPASCRGLLKHLLHIRETWVKEHLPDDLMAITERAKLVWAPRWRGSFTLSTSSSTIKRYCRNQLQYGKKQLLSVKEKLVREDCLDPSACCNDRGMLESIDERSEDLTLEDTSSIFPEIKEKPSESEVAAEVPEPRLLLDYMGGMDSRTDGVVIDGDEFFEPNEKLIEGSDCESEGSCEELDESLFHSTAALDKETALSTEEADKVEGSVDDSPETEQGGGDDNDDDADDSDESPGAVVLEETPLPRMFIPGEVIHVYSHRGVYRAAYVPRTFRELRRISLAGNMLSDHRTKSYYEALLEVNSVRNAAENPPTWTAFDEDDTCSCCASQFTWASTSDSEAQEARDKHNCRSCGTLVCHPCSTNMIPLPSIGLTVQARVCDRCYNDIDGLLTKPPPTVGAASHCSILSNEQDVPTATTITTALDDKPERQRERRSAVVDELASRVQASTRSSSSEG